jgi:hypothetical protein
MIKKLLGLMFAMVFLANFCKGQSDNSLSATNWGQSVNGVELSISLSNNVIPLGSTTRLQCRVKNSSTNFITWGVLSPAQGFTVSLTNNLGKAYRLTPDESKFTIISYSSTCEVEAGETYECSVPIVIGKNVEPGNYQLEANQHFLIRGKRPSHELTSNLLDVQIK